MVPNPVQMPVMVRERLNHPRRNWEGGTTGKAARDLQPSKDTHEIFCNWPIGRGGPNFSRERMLHSSDRNRRERDPRQHPPAMLALSPQLLQPDAPPPPPTPHRASISTSALSDASMVSSNDQLSSQSPRFFLASLQRRRRTEQKPNSTASAAAWWTRWTCWTARSASRHPDRSTQPAAQAILSSSA